MDSFHKILSPEEIQELPIFITLTAFHQLLGSARKEFKDDFHMVKASILQAMFELWMKKKDNPNLFIFVSQILNEKPL